MSAKQYRRKQDGHTVGPFTEAEMKQLAGFAEGEWEAVEPAPNLPADGTDETPKTKRTRKRARTAAEPEPSPADEPDATPEGTDDNS